MTYCGVGDLAINSFAYMSELALPQCLLSGSWHLVPPLCWTASAEGKHSKISGDNCYFQHTALSQTQRWSIFCNSHVLNEIRQSGKLNLWTKHVDTECYTINLRKRRVFCHYQGKSGLFFLSPPNHPTCNHSRKKTAQLRIETCLM